MKYVIVALVALSLTGCAREITIENQEGHVSSIGPIELDEAANVIVHYTLRDPEGDDQDIRVDVCSAPDEDCGIAVEGLGGDSTTRLPTVPAATDVPHEFRWAQRCGRWQGQDLVESKLDRSYVVGITVTNSPTGTVYSEPFTLNALGATAGDCAE